jgi:predicted anti-sigma-YlaC factor YlaD
MDCDRVEAYLSSFIENDLPADLSPGVSSHIQGCESCRSLKEKMEQLIYLSNDLQEDVPFFLKNRLHYLPEREEREYSKSVWLKWVAAVVGTVVLFLNLFYFTNIFPPAHKTLHILVSQVQHLAVETGAFLGRLKGSNDQFFFGLFNEDEKNGETKHRKESEVGGSKNG